MNVVVKAPAAKEPCTVPAAPASDCISATLTVVPNMFLSVYAGLAVRFGLPPLTALRAVTSDPADILGIGDRVGRLAPGYDADIVVWSGDPLEMASRPERIWVGGSVADLAADNGGTAAWQQK